MTSSVSLPAVSDLDSTTEKIAKPRRVSLLVRILSTIFWILTRILVFVYILFKRADKSE